MEVRKDHQECSHATLVDLRRGDGDYGRLRRSYKRSDCDHNLGHGVNTAGLKHSTKITATVVAIEPATRTITLRGPKGNQMSIEAGPQVQNFAQIKAGDQVKVEYVEALTLELKKGSTA